MLAARHPVKLLSSREWRAAVHCNRGTVYGHAYGNRNCTAGRKQPVHLKQVGLSVYVNFAVSHDWRRHFDKCAHRVTAGVLVGIVKLLSDVVGLISTERPWYQGRKRILRSRGGPKDAGIAG